VQAGALSSALTLANAPACDVRNLSSFPRIRRSPRALARPTFGSAKRPACHPEAALFAAEGPLCGVPHRAL